MLAVIEKTHDSPKLTNRRASRQVRLVISEARRTRECHWTWPGLVIIGIGCSYKAQTGIVGGLTLPNALSHSIASDARPCSRSAATSFNVLRASPSAFGETSIDYCHGTGTLSTAWCSGVQHTPPYSLDLRAPATTITITRGYKRSRHNAARVPSTNYLYTVQFVYLI